jgi:hypothetical protein
MNKVREQNENSMEKLKKQQDFYAKKVRLNMSLY